MSQPLAPQPLRVLHVNAGNLYGGVETLLTTLANSRDLCPDMEPHFAFCYEGRSSREIEASGAALHLLGHARISRPWTVWRARRRLRQLLGNQSFDVVICHMGWSMALFGKEIRRAGCNLALWVHGFHDRGNWLERMARRNRPDIVIANSRYTASVTSAGYPDARLGVVYCAVAAPKDQQLLPQRRASIRQELGAPEDATVILQVGRLEPGKGHPVTLRALARLDAGRNWTCWIAGGAQTPEEEQYLKELINAAERLGISDRVRFLGQRSDVAALMAAADIFCQPCQNPESFGIVFVEAFWAGLPVVTSAIGGAVEVVDESCGVLVQPGDEEGLAQSLDMLIASPNLRARLGAAGPERAKLLCDPASQLEKLHNLIRAEQAPELAEPQASDNFRTRQRRQGIAAK